MSTNNKTIPSRIDGFTLLEILVSMAILAISLTIIMELFSGGLKSSYLSKKYIDAVYLAREKMEEILANENLRTTIEEGESYGVFRWRTEVNLVEEEEPIPPQLPFSTFEIRVKVMWGDGEHRKNYEIHTMKMAKKVE